MSDSNRESQLESQIIELQDKLADAYLEIFSLTNQNKVLRTMNNVIISDASEMATKMCKYKAKYESLRSKINIIYGESLNS